MTIETKVTDPVTDPVARWSLCYDRFSGQVTTFIGLKVSDIKETVTTARDAGNTVPIHNNIKAWMLKHVVASINEGGSDSEPLADRVVITDNKV